jgi:hypothetical protein
MKINEEELRKIVREELNRRDEIDMRSFIRNELTTLLSKKKGEYEELKLVLQPERFKKEIRGIITAELDIKLNEAFIERLRQDIYIFIHDFIETKYNDRHVDVKIEARLGEINIKEVVAKKVEDIMISNTKEFVGKMYSIVKKRKDREFSINLQRELNLKTSTISEIKQNITPIDSEREIMDKLFDEQNKKLLRISSPIIGGVVSDEEE